jgi:hypothetical protein
LSAELPAFAFAVNARWAGAFVSEVKVGATVTAIAIFRCGSAALLQVRRTDNDRASDGNFAKLQAAEQRSRVIALSDHAKQAARDAGRVASAGAMN